ncbi:MAG TPA: methyltransferase domain-containing protein, partial [Rubrobacteraceae bacterium]|nr:methyltransferase domain-containing protein [Rubrobacteraceae bacterium]
RSLRGYESFTSVAATAEATTMEDHSVDFVAAGQAFHWFEPGRARTEFIRILRPGGWTVLVWNTRRGQGKRALFLQAYERLLDTYGTDYGEVGHGRHGSQEEVRAFFAPSPFEAATFDNRQVLDLCGLKGRLLSSSYVPAEGEPNSAEMLRDLERTFHEHQENGAVTIEYDTRVYYGRLW